MTRATGLTPYGRDLPLLILANELIKVVRPRRQRPLEAPTDVDGARQTRDYPQRVQATAPSYVASLLSL